MFNFLKKDNGEKNTAPAADELSDLLMFIVKQLVDNPSDVVVKEINGDKGTVLELKVNEADMGKVIGKKGRIIKSLRIVVRAAAVHKGKSVSVEIV